MWAGRWCVCIHRFDVGTRAFGRRRTGKAITVTLANRITFFRLFAVPVFCLLIFFYAPEREWLRWAALALYALAGLSDALDGFVARRLNQRSELGARLDPLADKLTINLGLVFVASNAHFEPAIPLWFPVIVLTRDIVIVLGALLINEFYGPVRVKPRISGKITTVLQIATLIGFLLGVSFAPELMTLALVATLFSFADYIWEGTRQANHLDAA